MSNLTQQELIRIKRAAEDAAYAMNRNYKPFIEAVSHPLNIIALVDMAQSSLNHQSKVDELQKRVDISDLKLIKLSEFIYGSGDLREYSDEELLEHQRSLKAILDLEQALKGGSDENQ